MAVGGTWGGAAAVDTAAFPASMVVDYVRVYRQQNVSVKPVADAALAQQQPAVVYRNKVIDVVGNCMREITFYALYGTRVFTEKPDAGAGSSHAACTHLPGMYIVIAVKGNECIKKELYFE